MRTNLVVPFSEKDQAKALGARWDPARKLWYVDKLPDLAPFARWISGESPATAGKAAPPRALSAAAETQTGTNYLAVPCDCLPWLGCGKCATVLETKGWFSKA